MQIEWLTAGDCIAGMHEVVVTSRTIDAIKIASEQNRSLWRVSSTVSVAKHFIRIALYVVPFHLVGIYRFCCFIPLFLDGIFVGI